MSNDSCKHPHGRSVKIFDLDEGVNRNELKKIFDHAEVMHRKVVILSIIGCSRGGKSLFLNYVLRFLYGNVSENIFYTLKFSLN
jgi:hypothetical protein